MKNYTIHVVAASNDCAELVEILSAELAGSSDAELLDQAAAIVADRGHVVLKDADGGCCVVDDDDIAITVDPGDLTTEDKYWLGHITTSDETGTHFTSIYPDDWLARMERLGYISIHRPVHEPTGIPYGPDEWSVEVVQEMVDGWDWDDIEADYAEEVTP